MTHLQMSRRTLVQALAAGAGAMAAEQSKFRQVAHQMG
jgi:hypothetical protein